MAHILYAEKAFLQLTARRILGYRRDAESRGHVYVDVGQPAPLQCGVRAKYRFIDSAGGYAPAVTLRKSPLYSEEEMLEIASELLDSPAVLKGVSGSDLEYVRKSDTHPESTNEETGPSPAPPLPTDHQS